MKNDIVFKITQLSVGYGSRTVLVNLSLDVAKGEICVIIGEEGAGKSTLQKALAGRLAARGQAFVNGRDVSGVQPHLVPGLGLEYVLQGGNVLPSFTVGETLRLARRHFSPELHERAENLTDRFFPKISQMTARLGGNLSGGERMMLSLACLSASPAKVFVLDEPTAGLSLEACRDIGLFLGELRQNAAVLLLEHHYDFAFEHGDSVVILKNGRLSRKFSSDEFRTEGFIERELYGEIPDETESFLR